MAQSPQEVIESSISFANSTNKNPADIFLSKLRRLDGIIRALRRGPGDDLVRIFGSAANKPDMIPRDIDAFIDLSRMEDEERHTIKDHLLNLAVTGGYHGNYGWFDPFVLERGRMKTRSEHDSIIDVRWALCHKPEEMREAAMSGIPLIDFKRFFLTQFEHHAHLIKAAS